MYNSAAYRNSLALKKLPDSRTKVLSGKILGIVFADIIVAMETGKRIGFGILAIFFFFVLFRPLHGHFVRRLREEKNLKQTLGEEREILGNINVYNFRVAEIQRQLKEKGFEPGSIDGKMGEFTRRAIREFQVAVGERPSGFLNKTTWFKLGEPAKLASLMDKDVKTEEIKKDYPRKEDLQTEIMEHRLRNKDRVKAVQTALKNAGFDPGPVDGKMGEKTKQAVMAFQKSRGLTPDGVVGTKTWEALNR